jgi:alpha-glucuronidase
MKSGRTLWQDLVVHYQKGVDDVAAMQASWAGLADDVDPERFAQVRDFLAIQHREAIWWRDACLAYFEQFSKRAFPDGYKPKYPLGYYKKMPFGASPKP